VRKISAMIRRDRSVTGPDSSVTVDSAPGPGSSQAPGVAARLESAPSFGLDAGTDAGDPRLADAESPLPSRRGLRYLWLVYLAFFLLGPILYGNWVAVAWSGLGVALFLPLYLWADRLVGLRLWLPIAGMVALGVVFARQNPGSSVFFIYAAADCARLGSRRRVWVALGTILGVVAATALLLQSFPFFWAPAAVFVVVIGLANLHDWEIQLAHREIRRSRLEVARLARIAERERIARDLHDLLGHTLSLVVLKSELAARLAERDPVRAAAEIREVETVARQALHEVRAAVASYRGETLAGELANARRVLAAAEVTLAVAVERATAGVAKAGPLAPRLSSGPASGAALGTGLDQTSGRPRRAPRRSLAWPEDGVVQDAVGGAFDHPSDDAFDDAVDALPPLPPAVETVLALALREAVTNVVRHARARHCRVAVTVALEPAAAGEGAVGGEGAAGGKASGTSRVGGVEGGERGRWVRLEVCDDGRGPHGQEGNGLRGMRERLALLGGTLEITAAAGGGTRLVLSLPLGAGRGELAGAGDPEAALAIVGPGSGDPAGVGAQAPAPQPGANPMAGAGRALAAAVPAAEPLRSAEVTGERHLAAWSRAETR
jgi:signal transduction histidine kinase